MLKLMGSFLILAGGVLVRQRCVRAWRQEQEALEGQVQRLAQRKQEQKAHRRNVRMGKGHKKK